jgi:general secretion pathway protein H
VTRRATPDAGAVAHTRSRGFTLVEVLVVLTIVGIVISGVSLSLNVMRGRDTDLALERLRWVLEATAERATIHGQPIAIELISDGYRFSVLDTDGRWTAYEAPPLFTEKRLPDTLRWGLLHTASGARDRLVFGSRAPAFQLYVRTPDGTVRYTGRATGAVTLERGTAAQTIEPEHQPPPPRRSGFSREHTAIAAEAAPTGHIRVPCDYTVVAS